MSFIFKIFINEIDLTVIKICQKLNRIIVCFRKLFRSRNATLSQDLAAGHDTVFYGLSAKMAAAHGEEWQRLFGVVNALGK